MEKKRYWSNRVKSMEPKAAHTLGDNGAAIVLWKQAHVYFPLQETHSTASSRQGTSRARHSSRRTPNSSTPTSRAILDNSKAMVRWGGGGCGNVVIQWVPAHLF